MSSSSDSNANLFSYAVVFALAAYISLKLGHILVCGICAFLAFLFLVAVFMPSGVSKKKPSSTDKSDIPVWIPDIRPISQALSAMSNSPGSDEVPASPPAPVCPPVNVSSALPSSIRGHTIAYRYEDVGIFIPKDSTFDVEGFEPGAVLTLMQDKENENDPNAVGLRLRKRLVGYLYRGKLQDMANDWFKKELPMRAVLTKTFREDKRAEVLLAFYDLSDFKKLRRRYPDAKEYRLTANANSEMQDNILMCSKGDECTICFDMDKEKYLVSSGLEIGYLPVSAGKLVEKYGEESCRVYIADISTNDNDKEVVTVYVFPSI